MRSWGGRREVCQRAMEIFRSDGGPLTPPSPLAPSPDGRGEKASPLVPRGGTLQALLDVEVELVRLFGWSLHEIDETDITSMMEFIGRLGGRGGEALEYCDQVDWF